MVKYLTDDEAEPSYEEEEETSIETSILNLLVSGSTPAEVRDTNPPPKESTLLDTDGPGEYTGDRSLCSGMIMMSILLSSTTVAATYLFMGAYTYPVWT